MADIGTPVGARDWAVSWLVGDPSVPWASRTGALRRIADAADRIRYDYPAAARELRAILLLAEMGYGPAHCMEPVRIARDVAYEKQWGKKPRNTESVGHALLG